MSDNKVDVADGSNNIKGWRPALRSAYDYYPFGMLMPCTIHGDSEVKCTHLRTFYPAVEPLLFVTGTILGISILHLL